jgi:hypothetical protein
MFIGRFLMIIPMLAVAGSLVQKKIVPVSAGTFLTDSRCSSGWWSVDRDHRRPDTSPPSPSALSWSTPCTRHPLRHRQLVMETQQVARLAVHDADPAILVPAIGQSFVKPSIRAC